MKQAKPVISFQKVSKKYHLQHDRTFKELIPSLLQGKKWASAFWALQNISFQIAKGETVGFIGPNGSGKSTVLKLISQITKPTIGSVAVSGMVSSLIELGAGFHPDLTGRENVYINGLILGMTRKEIDSKFDDIVAFSEIAPFIDEPVKHYSSGMYLRLGFSVAIHTNPDILLVDEILAVGDELFQKKCFRKIRELQRQSVTIVVVSHNLNLLKEYCDRLILLDKGMVCADGSPAVVIGTYETLNYKNIQKGTPLQSDYIKHIQFSLDGKKTDTFIQGGTFTLTCSMTLPKELRRAVLGIAIIDEQGLIITGPNTKSAGVKVENQGRPMAISYTIPSLPLNSGIYYVSVSIYDESLKTCYEYLDKKSVFRVSKKPAVKTAGPIVLQDTWHIQYS